MPAPKTPSLSQHVTTLAIGVDLSMLKEAGDSRELSEERRRELLAEARKGEVVELDIPAVVFSQTKTKRPLPAALRSETTTKCVAFYPDELGEFAKSFKGLPFLRDHDGAQLAVGGYIAESELDDSGERFEIRQQLRIVTQWAAVAALEGTMRTFSIQLREGAERLMDSAYCSVCGEKMFRSECSHFPGDEVSVELPDGKQKLLVELMWRGVRGKETSAVPFPAAGGTGIEAIHSALAEARNHSPSEDESMADNDMAERLAKLEKSQVALEADLAAERDLRGAAESALAEERDIRESALAEERRDEIAKTHARLLGTGLMLKGDLRDKYFDVLAARETLDDLRMWVATLERISPVGDRMQSDPGRTNAPAEGGDEIAVLCRDKYRMPADVAAQLRGSTLKDLGLSEADFVAHGQHNYWQESN